MLLLDIQQIIKTVWHKRLIFKFHVSDLILPFWEEISNKGRWDFRLLIECLLEYSHDIPPSPRSCDCIIADDILWSLLTCAITSEVVVHLESLTWRYLLHQEIFQKFNSPSKIFDKGLPWIQQMAYPTFLLNEFSKFSTTSLTTMTEMASTLTPDLADYHLTMSH